MPLFSNSGIDFAIPVAAGLTTPQPQAYRVRVRLLTDDGLGPRLITDGEYDVIVDNADLPAQIVIPPEQMPPGSCSVNGVAWSSNDPNSPDICRTEHRDVAAVSEVGRWNSERWSSAEIIDGYVVFEVVQPPQVRVVSVFCSTVRATSMAGRQTRWVPACGPVPPASMVDDSWQNPNHVCAAHGPAFSVTAIRMRDKLE